jgi:hypothetical protein
MIHNDFRRQSKEMDDFLKKGGVSRGVQKTPAC